MSARHHVNCEAEVTALRAELAEALDGLFNVYIALGEDPDGARNAAQLFGPVATPPGKWIPQVVAETIAEYERNSDREHERVEEWRRIAETNQREIGCVPPCGVVTMDGTLRIECLRPAWHDGTHEFEPSTEPEGHRG